MMHTHPSSAPSFARHSQPLTHAMFTLPTLCSGRDHQHDAHPPIHLPSPPSLVHPPALPSNTVGVTINMMQGVQQAVMRQGQAGFAQERQLDILQQWALVSVLFYSTCSSSGRWMHTRVGTEPQRCAHSAST